MAYKVLINNTIVDAIITPVYLQYNRKAKKFLLCKEDRAEFVVSHDNETRWMIVDSIDCFENEYDRASLVEITTDEALFIIEAIDAGKAVEVKEVEEADVTREDLCEDIDVVRHYVVEKMCNACMNAVLSGIDFVDETGSISHYGYSIEDQINILSLQSRIEKYGDNIPYHADGCDYRMYRRDEFENIVDELIDNKITHCVYLARLKKYINDMGTTSELADVYYGMEIPKQYLSDGFNDPSLSC